MCRLYTTLAPQAPWHCFPGCLWLCRACVLYYSTQAVMSFRAFLSTPGVFLRLTLCGFIGGFIFKTCHWERGQVIRGARLFLGSAVPGWLTALGSKCVRSTKAASVLRPAQLSTLRSWEAGTGREQGTAGKWSCSGQGEGLRAARRLLWAPRCQGREGRQRPGWKQGRFPGSFSGFCRYQPLAFEGKYPNQ